MRWLDTGCGEELPDTPALDVSRPFSSIITATSPAEPRQWRGASRSAPGGVFVAFENVRAETEVGNAVARERWATWLRRQGREENSVRAQLVREGTKFFPVRVSQHERLLTSTGFSVVERIWRAYGQASLLCIKGPAPAAT